MSDNDLWIAATASSYDAAPVTCDRDQARIADLLHGVILFAAYARDTIIAHRGGGGCAAAACARETAHQG